MLGKILGLVVAGVFVGAAVVEIVTLTRGERNGKEPLPGETPDEDAQRKQLSGQTPSRTQRQRGPLSTFGKRDDSAVYRTSIDVGGFY